MKNYRFIRFIEFGELFEIFFLFAILTILGIRIYLKITGFPQIGSGPFHIAHLLFGGFFMLASIIGSMTFLNNDLKRYWAVLGGIGFGTFIDEVGKFVTSDNNYFFQPTFAIIYVIFVLLYLFYKSVEHNQNFTKEEYLINSISILEDYELKYFNKEEKTEALYYLELSDHNNPLTKQLIKLFSESGPLPPEKLNFYQKIKKRLLALYNYLLKKPWFLNAISLFFIIRSLIYLTTGIFLLDTIGRHIADGTINIFLNNRGFLPVVQAFALTLQAVFTIIGVIAITESRRKAYSFFRDAVLVSIFILQVLNFYRNPVLAFFSTTGDLMLLGILTSAMHVEKRRVSNKIA